MQPHRGTTVLVLGILGIVVCPICGIIAWVMGNKDIPLMEQGAMDPAGMDSTKAGKICGIIATILACIGVVVSILYFILMAVVFGSAAAAGGV